MPETSVTAVIDLHSHVLPGVDDGPRTMEQSVEIARAAAADGVRILAATPHVREDWPTRPETMHRLVEELRTFIAAEAVPLDLRPGGEIALSYLAELGDEDVDRFRLGGAPAVLLEFPYWGWPLDLGERVFQLATRGLTAIIAHPERSAVVQAEPDRLRQLVEQGALVQLTAASVDGRLGRPTREAAFKLLDAGLAHLLASDAHEPSIRGVGLSGAAAAVGDQALARWLTEDVPGAVLAGEPVPERPRRKRRRRLRL
jgi:protein-tyrosine phosphatase